MAERMTFVVPAKYGSYRLVAYQEPADSDCSISLWLESPGQSLDMSLVDAQFFLDALASMIAKMRAENDEHGRKAEG